MPKLIHSHLNYFGDAEYGLSHAVGAIKRIRAELDPKFVPVFRRQVWQYDSGAIRVFKNFGFGVGVSEFDHSVYPEFDDAVKPSGPPGTPNAYLGSLERVGRITFWLPIDQSRDGTPGNTETLGDWCYYAIKESLDYKLKLQAEAIEKARTSLDYTASREHFRIQEEQRAARVRKIKEDADKSFEPDKARIMSTIKDMTSADYNQFYGEQKGFIKKPEKPFVSLSQG